MHSDVQTAAAEVKAAPMPEEHLAEAEASLLDSSRKGSAFTPHSPVQVRASVLRDMLGGAYGTVSYRGLRAQNLIVSEALDLSYLEWKGALQLATSQFAKGIDLSHAKISGSIDLDGSEIERLNVTAALIEGSIFIRDGAVVHQGIRAIGLQVKQSFNVRASTIWAPKESPTTNALEMFRAKIDGNVFMIEGADIKGGAYLNLVRIGGHLRLEDARFSSRAANGWPDATSINAAIDLRGAQIDGNLVLTRLGKSSQLIGRLSLEGASCSGF